MRSLAWSRYAYSIQSIASQLTLSQGEFVITDKKSRHGTYLKDAKLHPEEQAVLHDQDELLFAKNVGGTIGEYSRR